MIVLLQRALLYSGVNQLAGGRHSGEDSHKNALKTMQRAVLLCPGKHMHIVLLHTINTVFLLLLKAENVQSKYMYMKICTRLVNHVVYMGLLVARKACSCSFISLEWDFSMAV